MARLVSFQQFDFTIDFHVNFTTLFIFSNELLDVYKDIFHEKSTIDDKIRAFAKLKLWKLKTGQDTQAGILCTLIILDVHIKDVTRQVTDSSILKTLYSSSFTKFINYATSFQQNPMSMYKSANRLGIDSFLIDLRHLCAHGKVMPSVDVFRQSMKICFKWIENYYWKSEIDNVSDSNNSNFLGLDVVFIANLRNIFSLYDSLIELMHKSVQSMNDDGRTVIGAERLEKVEQFMTAINKERFFPAIKMLTKSLAKIIESKQMLKNSSAFFSEMILNCQYFMSTTAEENQSFVANESCDENSSQDSSSRPAKRRWHDSVVSLYQDLIWHIARQGYLKMFIDKLHEISARENEDSLRRASASFWICTILSSFQYYQKYLQFVKQPWTAALKITVEVRKIYSYQLDADLRKAFNFVGTQMPPALMKYSQDFLQDLTINLDDSNVDVCLSVLPYIQPPLTHDQMAHFKNLINVRMRNGNETKPLTSEKIYTLEDLMMNGAESMDFDDDLELIWQISQDNIDWKTQPFGVDVSCMQN